MEWVIGLWSLDNPGARYALAAPCAHRSDRFGSPALLLAAEVYLRFDGKRNDGCAKLHHQNNQRCIHCGYKMTGKPA